MWNLKEGTNELTYKTEVEYLDIENKLMMSREWGLGLTYMLTIHKAGK